MKRIIIGSDHAGFKLKSKIIAFLKKKRFSIKDVGTYCEASCDYPVYAYAVAKEVSRGKFKMGILVCKSGIGNSIVANKLKGVRAALCYNLKAARLSRQHNDANILILGAGFVKADTAKKMVSVWLATKFEGGRHRRRVNLIKKIEAGLRR
ncbi:MAG: ribose 5-phosphate isomerase B [Candidatus Omnitrophica bacterium]|nr:ribose 5-phosphate isomerase B [Candidatus Omnitrophota bacterium]MDD5237120.1 ribose 5-phosphate isomerase B [Candidatus Omnitrophota bacterium]MDD5610909.1 ribose 5-phosphate isomerase B [Candidatus Omnitrophota bacterium]